jgi:hypothetical protein
MQILLRSPLMVEEIKGMRQTIGTFDDPHVKELWDADKLASDLENSKGNMYTRKYQCTYKVLSVYPHSRKCKRAHKIPIVLTMKGLNGTGLF